MKKLLILLCIFLSFSLYAQEAEEPAAAETTSSSGIKASKGGISEIPDSKRPKPIDMKIPALPKKSTTSFRYQKIQ